MNEDNKIHLNGRRAAYLAPGQAPIIRIRPDVYNMLVDIVNDTTSSMSAVACNIIKQAIEKDLIVYDKDS